MDISPLFMFIKTSMKLFCQMFSKMTPTPPEESKPKTFWVEPEPSRIVLKGDISLRSTMSVVSHEPVTSLLVVPKSATKVPGPTFQCPSFRPRLRRKSKVHQFPVHRTPYFFCC